MSTGWGQIHVEMTSRCNLRCRTCLYPAFEERWLQEDLSADAFQRIVDIAAACDSIHLQGWGEPLLRDDLGACIKAIRLAGGRPCAGTNGTLMTGRTAAALIDAGLGIMTFSLAGPDARSNDALRGDGVFDRTIRGIAAFSDRRGPSGSPQVLLNYLLTPHSIRRLPKALSLCRRLGVDGLVATHLVHVGTDDQSRAAAFEKGRPPEWALFVSRLSVLWHGVDLVLPGMRPSPVPVCAKNPLKNAFVGADGAVSPCVYLCPPIRGDFSLRCGAGRRTERRIVMGRLPADDLHRIWHRPAYVAFREAFERRLDLYERIMPPMRTDFDGLEHLMRATRRIRQQFSAPALQPPAPCRGCPQLDGF